MSKRLQEDWARAAEEGPRVLMNLRVDFFMLYMFHDTYAHLVENLGLDLGLVG